VGEPPQESKTASRGYFDGEATRSETRRRWRRVKWRQSLTLTDAGLGEIKLRRQQRRRFVIVLARKG